MLNLGSYFPITDPTLIFLVVLLIILLAPIVMGKLRIPHIIGMVLAGVVVGKDGFNILVRDDILFYVRMRDGLSRIIVNVEAQKDPATDYFILNRAIYYESRLISSQKEREFSGTPHHT